MGLIKNKSNIWLATTKYYCEYFCIYALLMRIGIKCEIHDCTIEVCKFFEKENLLKKGTSNLLERDKDLRIENQYFLKNNLIVFDHDLLLELILNIKNIISSITNLKIEKIREKIIKT